MSILDQYLNELNQLPTNFRKRVEVFIIHDKQLIVGENDKWGKIMLQAPGGGVEKGQTFEKAATMECLEELGILIDKPDLISPEPLTIDWYTQLKGKNIPPKVRQRMKHFRGSKIYFMYGFFKKLDNRYYGREKDQMKRVRIPLTNLRIQYLERARKEPEFANANIFRANMLVHLKRKFPYLI